MIELDKLAAGASVIYYRGENLGRARQTVAKRPDPQLAAAQLAWSEALAGRVDLAQVRLPDGQYAYRATRRRVVDRNPVTAIVSEAPSFRRRAAA